MENDSFAVFILTHGRPDKVLTYKSLRKQGYTGKVYIIVDNEDQTIEGYRKLFGDSVIVFDKEAIAQTFDQADNFDDRRAVVYARNACFQIAADLGVRYFLQLDDDYRVFLHKFDSDLSYCERPIKNLDKIFTAILGYYKMIPALTVALAQNGDFIGGAKGGMAKSVWSKRKAMNTFFCSTDRPFQFVGRVNEDVNTYVYRGGLGGLFLTVNQAAIMQVQTQANTGGMSELYLSEGTYWKSFYPLLFCPSCVKIGEVGYMHRRIHHRIAWDNAVPCIVPETCRKV